MDRDKSDNPIKEVLDELFTLLETLESQNAAVLTFLKEHNIVTDEKFAPHLDRAETASSVKWRAARARMAYLLAPAPKKDTDQTEKLAPKEPHDTGATPKGTAPKDVTANDSEQKATDRRGQKAKNRDQQRPEPTGAERKDVSQKSSQPKDAESQTTASKGETHRADADDTSDSELGSGSDNNEAKRDSADSQTKTRDQATQQEAAKQNANAKAASAGQGDKDSSSRDPKSQDVSSQSRKYGTA